MKIPFPPEGAEWNGCDFSGRPLPAGKYLVHERESRGSALKMMLLR